MFLLKALLRTVPVALAWACCGDVRDGLRLLPAVFRRRGAAGRASDREHRQRHPVSSAVLPSAAYLLFLLGWLAIELCRAILRWPGRPDRPGEEEIV